MSCVTIYEPTPNNPYLIDKQTPLILRTACTAGINRSATVREYICPNIPKNSLIFPQYGAEYGDYGNKDIQYHTLHSDGFIELFDKEKEINIQTSIFNNLGYQKIGDDSVQILDEKHREVYKETIKQQFWTVKNHMTQDNKNVFILINENETVINLVLKRLIKINESVDYVILRIPDVIYTPANNKVKSQSVEAYKGFINIVKNLIEFV